MGWPLFIAGVALVAMSPQLAGDNNERGMVQLTMLGYVLMFVSLWLPD